MRTAAFLFILTLALGAPAIAATPAPGPEDLIRRIYVDNDPKTGKWIDWTDSAILGKYFDQSLVALIHKDAETSAAKGEVGCLDFDVFYDAQDMDEAGITTPRIRKVPGKSGVLYEVTFTGVSEAWKNWNVKLLYDVRKTAAGWRVHDIIYKSGHSLRKILNCN